MVASAFVSPLALSFGGMEWARPPGLWALVLPLLLLLVARLRTRPPARATGTLSLWRQVVGETTPTGAAARPRPPLSLWLAVLALVVGAVALAGPRFRASAAAVEWTVVVDHSPSLSLPWTGPDGAPDPAGRTRLGRGLDEGEALLAPLLAPDDRVRWLSSARPPLELAPGERPPAAWWAPPPWFAPSPTWTLHDLPGTLWVTDVPPAFPPADAGYVAVGGGAIPGPVGVSGRDLVLWDGAALREEPGAVGERRVAVVPGPDGSAVPPLLADLFREWAAGRGFTVLAPPGPAPAGMVLELAPLGEGPAGSPVTAGRDGWFLTGMVADVPGGGTDEDAGSDPAARSWLGTVGAAGGTVPLVEASPGGVRVAWRGDALRAAGDPAAFAVSWSRLFDHQVLPPAGIVPLAERRAAGAAASHPPTVPPRRAEARAAHLARGDRLHAWLAAASALLALAAVSAGLLRRSSTA